MAGCPPAKRQQLKTQFAKLDKDGNNTLDLEELKLLLRKGNPNLSDDEIGALYGDIDKNGDGVIGFDEFVDYIYGKDRAAHKNDHKVGGRHDRLHATAGPPNDGTEDEEAWQACERVFNAYAGKDMDNKEFSKFCKDQKLIGSGFTKMDVDIIWTKVCPKGKRRVDFDGFKDCCRYIAGKKREANGEYTNAQIQAIVCASDGPKLVGTQLEAVRFYDDKSTFTGAAAHNTAFGDGLDPTHGGDRHAAQQAATAADEATAAEQEGDWSECERVFMLFAGDSGDVDGREFLKMITEVGLINKTGCTKQDVDVVFTGSLKDKHGPKKLDFTQFKVAVGKIAKKRTEATYQVQDKIAASSGPNMTGATQLEAVRFYDDKSTYTGAAGEIFGRDGHDEGRHERLEAEKLAADAPTEDEHPWEECIDAYNAYLDRDGNFTSREFHKLVEDAELFDKKFETQSLDIIFVGAAGKGMKKLDEEAFKKGCRGIAKKKGVGAHVVQVAIGKRALEGPIKHATEAEYSRFHDDKDTYTGAHVGK